MFITEGSPVTYFNPVISMNIPFDILFLLDELKSFTYVQH